MYSCVFPASYFQYQEMTLAISLKKLKNQYGNNNDNNGVDLGSASTPADKHVDFPFSFTFTWRKNDKYEVCEIVFFIPAWSRHILRQGSKKVAFKSWCPSIGQHLAALNFEVSFQILKLPPMHGARCHCHCQMSKDDNEKIGTNNLDKLLVPWLIFFPWKSKELLLHKQSHMGTPVRMKGFCW